MKKLTIIALFCSGLVSSVFADVIFNNSTNDLKVRFNPGTFEVGDQIVLVGNARYLTNFSFEYWGTNTIAADNPLFSGNVEARIRFYKNDGPEFNGYASPGTCFWTSEWFALFPTARTVLAFVPGLDFAPYSVYLPSSEITWSVQFRGMGATDQVGVDFYSPSVVGSNYPDYWQRVPGDNSWALMTNSVPTDFAATIEATLIPEPAIPSLAISKAADQAVVSWPGWATNFVLETSTALSSWTPITSGIIWEDNNFVLSTDISPGNAFYRLHLP